MISDTHVQSFDELAVPVKQAMSKVDLIIHAGDITEMAVLDGLRQLAEVKVVAGNCDSFEIKQKLPAQDEFTACGKRMGLIHGFGPPWLISERVRERFTGVNIIIFGHSHKAYNKVVDGCLMFNPGTARESYGILTIDTEIKADIVKF